MQILRPLFPLMLMAAALAGCGGDEPQHPTADASRSETAIPDGPVTTDSGLEYVVIRQGNGQKPTAEDYVTVHYRAAKADGTTIDDSNMRGEPVTFVLGKSLPGWQEALKLMPEGSLWRIKVPPALAYGDKGTGNGAIGPNETLVFELELLRVENEDQMKSRQLAEFKEREERREMNKKYLEENMKKSGVTVLPSGLQYEVLVEGGGRKPNPTDMVRAHYRGTLIDGTEFDSSYKRGQPAEFAVNRLIKGWQEALPMMNEGSKWRLVVPADLAYGDRGAGPLIRPGDTLVFEIELLQVL